MNDTEQWFRTDETEDVAGSIRHALRCIAYIQEDKQAWKWVVLALHSALQGACVCHLVTTAQPVGVVCDEDAAKWLKYFDMSRDNLNLEPPATHILVLPELLRRMRRPRSAGDGGCESGISVTDDEMEWLKRIHKGIRNQLTHFEPMGWSIETSDIPALSQLIARIIGDILEAGWAFRQNDNCWLNSLQRDLNRLRSQDIWNLAC